MTHKTLTRDAFEVVGIEVRASNDDPSPIGELWGHVYDDPRMKQLGPVDADMIALYCEFEGDHTKPYTFFLGRRVTPDMTIPDGLVRRHVPAGTYAFFLADGAQPAKLIETWGTIWETPLRRRYATDYEIHRSATRVEVYVGVESA